MINVTDPAIYQLALVELAAFRTRSGRRFKGHFIQVFLGLKFWQGSIPSMFSNQYIDASVLQSLLDDLYSKSSRPLNDCVLMIFENSYHARTGLVGVGNRTSQNTWRNNLHLQKGIGCYAPVSDLSSPTFLAQQRVNCQYLNQRIPGALAGASCRFCPRGAEYRNEDHPKWLRINPGGHGFSVVDLQNVSNFLPYVAPQGNKIPILPLVIALYHDALQGLATHGRGSVDLDDFMGDFGFTPAEFATYFDDSPTNAHNQALLRAVPRLSYTPIQRQPQAGVRPPNVVRPPALVPATLPNSTQVAAPAMNSGWAAERFVAEALTQAGWMVSDVSRQRVGYDLLAQKGGQTRYVDAKSSVGTCSPSLTAREWQLASIHGTRYVLAIVENFDPNGVNTIHWVADPVGRCHPSRYTTVNYAVQRTSWRNATVPLGQI